MRVVNLERLTDSRLLYEKRPPLFGFLIIGMVLLALTWVVVWSTTTVRPSVVKAAGAIEGAEHAAVVSSVSGRVSEIQAPNGTSVEKGASVLTIESTELAVETQTLQAQRDSLVLQAALQARFTDAVNSEESTFNMDDPMEAQFGHQFESLQNKKAQLRVDRPSLEAQGYAAVEIDNAVRANRLEASELDEAALMESTRLEAELKLQINEVDIRLGGLETGKSAYTVAAEQSGEVYLDPSLADGTVVSAGSPLGSISSTAKGVRLSAYLSVTDRQFVSVGDTARVSVSGLPSVDYGSVEGTIVSIDTDITTVTTTADSASSSSYFVAEVQLDKNYITDKDDKQHELVNGTAVEVSLVYREMTYFEYFLDMLGFK